VAKGLDGLSLADRAEMQHHPPMRIAALVLILALGGCATSMAAIQDKPAQEVRVSPRSIDEIERCIILSQPGLRTPYAQTVNGVREITISQQDAGAVMFFAMRAVPGGTEVTFRRKGALVNYDDKARACYGGDGGNG
jgi:hypothetical protein